MLARAGVSSNRIEVGLLIKCPKTRKFVAHPSAINLLVLLGVTKMLETIAVILIILWVLGLVSSYTMGGFIHILLVIAVVVIVIRLIQGRRL
jgi:hypothetical protein